MNAEPEEQMRGSGQVIEVVNYPGSLREGHTAGPRVAVDLSRDIFTHSPCLFSRTPLVLFKLYFFIHHG